MKLGRYPYVRREKLEQILKGSVVLSKPINSFVKPDSVTLEKLTGRDLHDTLANDEPFTSQL